MGLKMVLKTQCEVFEKLLIFFSKNCVTLLLYRNAYKTVTAKMCLDTSTVK